MVVLQHQLVRCDTHMEGIGLGPALRYQEKVAYVGVKRKERTKGKHAKIFMGQKSGWKKRKSQEQHGVTEEGGKEIHLRKGPKIRRGINWG